MKAISNEIRRIFIKIAGGRSITFLGTGPSDPITDRSGKNNRKNTSSLIEYIGDKYLIDVPSDLDKGLEFDYLLTSHHHSDAFGGWKNIKNRKFIYGIPLPLYQRLNEKEGPWKAQILTCYSRNKLGKVSVIPFPVEHSYNPKFPTFGYQFIFIDGYKLTYASDVVEIPKKSEKYFNNIDMAVVDGAGWESNLPTHFGIMPFLNLVKEKKWNIGQIYFVQIGRRIPNFNKAMKEIKSINPRASLTFDGQKVTF